MEKHNLFQNTDALETTYPEFRDAIMDIIGGERQSTMKPDSVKNFQKKLAIYGTMNEDTFMRHMVPLVVKDTYLEAIPVQTKTLRQSAKVIEKGTVLGEELAKELGEGLVEEENPVDGERYAVKEWFDLGVISVINREFVRDFLPSKFPEHLVKALKKYDGMKNGKPDFCYGLNASNFPCPADVMISPDLENYLAVMPGTYHPFFLVEGKSNQGRAADAQNQARRGGAILVNSLRLLMSKIGMPDVAGADTRTFVFSATMTPDLVQLWVHWAEVLPDTVLFHMNFVKGVQMIDKENLPKMRAWVHNILGWGAVDRVSKVLTPLHTQLYKWQRDEMTTLSNEAYEKEQQRKNARKRPKGDVSPSGGTSNSTA